MTTDKDTTLKASEFEYAYCTTGDGAPIHASYTRVYEKLQPGIWAEVWNYIKENPTDSARIVGERFGLNPSTVKQHFPGWVERRRASRAKTNTQ